MSPEQRPNQNFNTKLVAMPDREVLVRQLQKLGVLGISDQSNTFFNRYSEYLADNEMNAAGVYSLWVKASTDTLSGEVPTVRAILDGYFDIVVEAVVPDKEVAQEAKIIREEMLKKLGKLAKAAEPKVKELGAADSLNDFERYSQARRIADIVFEYASPKVGSDIWMDDRRDGSANPYYNQTRRGFFLEQYYSSLSRLWTPWGAYGFGGGSNGMSPEVSDAILKRFGATLHEPVRHEEYGTVGPVWALHKIDETELPEPVVQPRSAFRTSEVSHKTWEKLTKRYHKAKGETAPLTTLEKFALDDAILEERGKKEPPINDYDIKSTTELSFFRGQVVKYTQDGGKTWHYTKLHNTEPQYYAGGVLGFGADREVLPNTQVHAFSALTAEDFERGMIVRPTKPDEIKGLKFSYEFDKKI